MNRCRLCERTMPADRDSPVCAWCVRKHLAPIAARHDMSVEDMVAVVVLADDTLVDDTLERVREESQQAPSAA